MKIKSKPIPPIHKWINLPIFIFFICLSNTINAQIKAAGLHNVDLTEKLCARIDQRQLSSQEAYNQIAKILSSFNLQYNGRVLECENFGGKVVAFIDEGQRWIAYDAAFMKRVSMSNDWPALGILAHELAHHLLNHSMYHPSSLRSARFEELDADDWAGFALGKMGATKEQSLLFLNEISHPTCTLQSNSTHPCKDKRREAVEEGWAKAQLEKPQTIVQERIVQIDDRDGDGLSNAVDKCPDEFGPVSNMGCPRSDTNDVEINDNKLEKVLLDREAPLKAEPYESAKILRFAPKGTEVIIKAELEKYFMVESEGVIGYIYSGYISPEKKRATISGTIRDHKNNILIGATILIEGTHTGTISDIDGSFSLFYEFSEVDILLITNQKFKDKRILYKDFVNGMTITLDSEKKGLFKFKN